MEIEINTGEGITRSDAVDAHIEQKLAGVRRRFGADLTRVRVYLKDVSGGKKGHPRHCTMEARPEHMDPIAVHAEEPDVYACINEAAHRLERAVAHRFGRVEERH